VSVETGLQKPAYFQRNEVGRYVSMFLRFYANGDLPIDSVKKGCCMKCLAVLFLLITLATGCGGNEVDASEMSSLVSTTDDANGMVFYFDNRSQSLQGTYFYPYIAQRGDNFWLRLKIIYRPDTLIFIEKYIVTTPDRTFTIEPNLDRLGETVEVDWIDGESVERFDGFVADQDLEMLRAVATSPATEVRFVGSQGEGSVTLSATERKIVASILAAYEKMIEQ